MRSIEDIIAESGYDPDDPLLLPSEAAVRLRVSPETVRRWIRLNQIPSVPIGPHKLPRVRASVVAKLLSGGTPTFHVET